MHYLLPIVGEGWGGVKQQKMENTELKKEIKSCFRKHMNYTETRDYILDLSEYEHNAVIRILQREYVKHKTKTSRVSMLSGLIMLIVFPLVHWYFNHNEIDYETDYKPMVFGIVIIASAFVSFQRAKAAAQRFEELE